MILPLLALLLAAVLAVSGTAKLLDLRGSAASLRGFGVPERLVPPLATGLPLAELAIAATLLPVPTGRAAAAAAAVLFCGFALAVAVTLLRGRRPDCGCFGRLHSTPIGVGTLARATSLAGVAGLLAWYGTGSGVGVLDDPVAWLALTTGGQSVLLVAVLRRHGRVLAELDEPGGEAPVELVAGSPAPEFTLPDLAGDPVSLTELRGAGLPTLIVFGNPGCGACTALLPQLGQWQREHRARLTVALVTQGDADVNRAEAGEHGLELVLLQREGEVGDAYGIQATPAAVLVDRDGRVDGPIEYGADGVEAVLERALALSPAAQPRTAALAAAVVAATAAAAPAVAASADEEDVAIAELKRILKARDPGLRREAKRVAAKTQRLFDAPRSAAVKFELTAAIALAKKEIRWTIDELGAVPVPDYRPGERGARIAKSRSISYLSYLDRVLDLYAKGLKARTVRELQRLDNEVYRLSIEMEKNRRAAAKLLGCSKKLEEC